MVIGECEMTVTHATLLAALQLYFSSKTFAAGACPLVINVQQTSSHSNAEFKLKLAQPDAPPVEGA